MGSVEGAVMVGLYATVTALCRAGSSFLIHPSSLPLMTVLLSLLIRHGIAAFAGTLAAQGLTVDASSTASLLSALLIFLGASFWSWLIKLRWNKDSRVTTIFDDTTIEMVRKLVGAFASQAVAAISGYLATQGHAVDAGDPVALSVFGANLALSKAGVHQKLAALGSGKAALLLLLSVSSVGSVGCSNLTPSQRQQLTRTTLSLSQLGLSLAASRGVIKDGDKLLINDGLALLMQPDSTTRDKLMRLGALGLTAAVQRGLVKDGDVILIREATAIVEGVAPAPVTSAKAPVNVGSGDDSSPPHSASIPACLTGLLAAE